jgi:DNA-binding CsgD family transcriptional regulator
VASIDARDAAALLQIVHDGARYVGPEPFPPSVLLDLANVIPSDACVGYQEADVRGAFRVVELVEVIGTPPSPTTEAAFHTFGWQNPMHCGRNAHEERVLRLSDLLTRRQRRRLEYDELVWRPHGIDDALRTWLPAPPGRARSIYLERTGKDYTERERRLFALLRPHLVRMRANAEARRRMDGVLGLTPREAEVLGWVARGLRNAEIAEALVISPQTVRKHLENLFEKLGVRTRSAAVARVRAAADLAAPSAPSETAAVYGVIGPAPCEKVSSRTRSPSARRASANTAASSLVQATTAASPSVAQNRRPIRERSSPAPRPQPGPSVAPAGSPSSRAS